MTEEDSKPLWVDVEGLSSGSGGDAQPVDEEYIAEAEPEGEPAPEEEVPGKGYVVLNPANFEVPKGREFRISVEIRSELEIGSLTVNLGFNPQIARLKEVTEGGLGRKVGEKVPFLSNIDNSSGACTIGLSSPTPGQGIKGGGILAVLVFEALEPGEGVISVSGVTANGPTGESIQFETNESRLMVR